METLSAADILPAGALSILCGSAGDLLDHVEEQDVLAFTGSADTGVHNHVSPESRVIIHIMQCGNVQGGI